MLTNKMESTNSVLNPVFGSVTIQELHERFDNTDPNIEQHFSMEELARMSEYEKMRLRNIKRNYLAMNAMGIAFSKPDFMQRKIKTKAPVYQIWSSSDTDSDEEWIPNAPKKRPPRLPKMGMVPNKSRPVEKIPKKTSDANRKNSLKRLETDCREEILASSQMPEPETSAKIPNNQHPEEEQGKFCGFTDRFIEKRLKALYRAIRHKQRLVDLLESDKLPMTYLDILDPLVLSDDEEFEQDKYGRWMKKKKLMIVSSRYPRRNINRLNYAALEVPSDDEFLYCEDCHREFQGACPEHGPLNFIPEKEEINFSLIGTDLYAKDTLLPYLMIKQSLIRGAGQGVFTQVNLTKNSVFGPYDGQLTKNSTEAQDSGYSWLVFRDSKGHHYVDGQHKGHSNWMRYVNCACNEQEQNLIAFQYQGRIYYKVLHDINPGSELLVWYGDEYAKELGLEVQDNSVELKDNNQLLDDLKVHHQGGVVNTNKTLCPRCKFLFLEDRIHLHNCGSIKNGEGAYQCIDCLQMYGSEEYLVKHRRAKHGVVLPLEYIKTRNASFGIEMNDQSRSELGCQAMLYSGNNDTSKVSTGENSGLREQIMCIDEIQQFYFCGTCVMQFNDFEKYKLHTNEHNCNSEYKQQCPTLILNRSNDCSYKGTYTYKCQYCDKMFSDLSYIKIHERTHTGEKPYKCQYCENMFSQFSSCKNHERTHTGEKPYKCQYCDKMFSQLVNCKNHERTHTGEKPYKCQYCDKMFSQLSVCQKHERIHTGEKPYKCQYCDKMFSQLVNCKKHERTHTGEKPYKCQYCDKMFSRLDYVKEHERTHTGEKPYKCQYCDKVFSQLNHMKTHGRIHTGEKPYKCQYCDKMFSQLSVCQKHERIHTGEKPYKCQYCDKMFSNTSHIKRHERTHTGEKSGLSLNTGPLAQV